MEKRKVKGVDEARRYLEQAATSGLSPREWAKSKGVDARSLNAYRVTLGRAEGARLVELVPAPGPGLVVRVGDVEIVVPSDFDPKHLGRVVQALRSC